MDRSNSKPPHADMAIEDRLLTPAEAAERCQRSPLTLRDWRCAGAGPPFIRLSARKVVYSEAALDEWLRRRADAKGRTDTRPWADRLRQLIEEAPPLDDEQRARLLRLLG